MFEYFSQNCRKNHVALQADKNNRHFTGRPICSYDNITLRIFYNEKGFRKVYRENQNTSFMFNKVCPTIVFFFLVSVEKYLTTG